MPDHIDDLIARARVAQAEFARGGQAAFDRACLAVAWALLKPENNRALSEEAVRETGFGDAEDKMRKNLRKTVGLLRDIRGQKSAGVLRVDAARGIVEIARPVGVVAALTPSTNPLATTVNKTVNALKGGNAIVLAPPPKGAGVGARLLALMRARLQKIGAPPDLAQMLLPPSKEGAARLMRAADLVVVTGSQRNVRAAHASGASAIGVGVGNVAVIIDETADVADAARKIRASKTFDNATSCSSENQLIAVDSVAAAARAALEAEGGVWLDGAQKKQLERALWRDGALNRDLIARPASVLAAAAGIDAAREAKFLVVEESEVGAAHPFSGEKMSPVLTAYRAADFAAAKARAGRIARASRRGAFGRNPHRAARARARTRARIAGLPRHRQSSALLRDRRQFRQRTAVFAVDGLRNLGQKCDRRKSQLSPFHQHHARRFDDRARRADGRRDFRRLLGGGRA